MRAPAGVAGTRPRRPAQAPTLPLHLAGFRKFPAARHLAGFGRRRPSPHVRPVAGWFHSCRLLRPLPLRQPPSWGRRQSWPLQEGSGCGHLPQPGTRTAAQRGALHLRSRNRGTPQTHTVNNCQPARRASLVPTQPACRLPAGIFPLPVAAARLWPAPPPRLTAAAATSGRFRLWSPRLPVSVGLQLRQHADAMGPSQWLPQSRLTANGRARAAQ